METCFACSSRDYDLLIYVYNLQSSHNHYAVVRNTHNHILFVTHLRLDDGEGVEPRDEANAIVGAGLHSNIL